jgi:hypothetical protein
MLRLHFGLHNFSLSKNLIVTRLRSRLNHKISDRLLRVRTQGKGITKHDFQSSLNR